VKSQRGRLRSAKGDEQVGDGCYARGAMPRAGVLCFAVAMLFATALCAQVQKATTADKKPSPVPRPKLVVMLVVDQMRGDYVDRFQAQWTGGLKRLLQEGAWFREAAYPYAATETCPGHATISTGAFPLSHGIVANSWWDRDDQQMVTCTSDPNATNSAYGGGETKGGDSAWRMKFPAFAQELKFQTGGTTRVVTISLKARAAITLAGQKADAVIWADTATGAWVTSSAFGNTPFVEDLVKKHPVTEDYGKSWSLSLPESRYLYDKNATGAGTVEGWTATFPHALHGKEGAMTPDAAFFEQWASSPFADTYLTRMAESAVDALNLGKAGGTDYLGVSYSTPDYIGHRYGPRSWEIQDTLIRLDKDLAELFTHLDQKVGKGNYVVALTGDHGVAPIPADAQKSGFDAGVLSLTDLENRMEKALEPFNYTKPVIARIVGHELYFSQGVYGQLRQDPAAMKAIVDTALATPGVAAVFRAEELGSGLKNVSTVRTAAELSYFLGRSGDLFILQQPYWLTDGSATAREYTGTGHGTPYYYDQHVPMLFMGFGIKPGEYFDLATPADIAPTFAALIGVTLAARDGRVLTEALVKAGQKPAAR
jgi:predicted AlkP superfamily pyrophosphatase or phosphodiesterase